MIHWHKRTFYCPNCQTDMSILEVLTSADDELRVNLWCTTCSKDFSWTSNWGRIRAQCILQDVACLLEKQKPKLLTAPQGMTDDDRTLLGEMHIKEQEDDR